MIAGRMTEMADIPTVRTNPTKRVGKMMLANNDFGIHAEIAGAAEDFDDASGGRSAAARIAEELTLTTAPSSLGMCGMRLWRVVPGGRQKLLAESGREFFAG